MVRVGQRNIGGGAPCFITFEAGATHDGIDTAMALVDHAAASGADAVKFQIFDPDRLVADKTMLFSYEVLSDPCTGQTETVEEPLYEILCRRYLDASGWKAVKARADHQNLAFFATVCFEEDIRLVQSMGCDSIKIASADINHWPLIRMAARTGCCIQLDTGMATIGEVEAAVDVCREEGLEKIIIHNCPSGYPARIPSINLRMIPTLKQMFPDFPVAFSDHTPGRDMDVAALAMGAELLEKTITLDRTIKSPEHMFSLEPREMAGFVRAIREVEAAMGQSRRHLSPVEKTSRDRVRRSAFWASDLRKGARVGLDAVEFRRPGMGVSPDRFETLLGARLVSDVEKGTMVRPGDLEPE